jgi:hypothetical protein
MQKQKMLGALVVAALAAGCATPEASTEPTRERVEPITGSNIPRKPQGMQDKVDRTSGESLSRQAPITLPQPMPGGGR